ncbi:uncharacterized protein B0I36DRAFT_337964 [Microdochium trichocladiopsis]|uniref:Plastocyanin-like domain-containing protein n=1 Tax=Microdochium trichocladiopsis TaxID=1682393 RepID=A0A9P9BMJ9_9PEZI|nr:uncharacterized protein B0I36DRAFT_337964 [Microdochium trichocladiopsis]KAH7016525.1 hypothetical protein B0I36DRAFT_337964 [Microdochium trichocladiopsis]
MLNDNINDGAPGIAECPTKPGASKTCTSRDATMAPANGWLVLAGFTDNPGAWLMHCHIAWHAEGGIGRRLPGASRRTKGPDQQPTPWANTGNSASSGVAYA